MNILARYGILSAYALVVLVATPAAATAGIAEWTIVTPGGNQISHVDGLKDQYGDCLTSTDRRVFVSHLVRWRYYPDHVIGQTERGYFLFRETTEHVRDLASERELLQAVQSLGEPVSPWLTGSDGWLEAWFPFVVWEPCRRDQRPMADVSCSLVDDPELLRRYRDTTWGRACERLRSRGGDDRSEEPLRNFCEALLAR